VPGAHEVISMGIGVQLIRDVNGDVSVNVDDVQPRHDGRR